MSAVRRIALTVLALPAGAVVALGGLAATSAPPATACVPATSATTQGALSGLQVVNAAQDAGFSSTQLATAVAVAKAESGWDPDATHYNTNGSTDYGLWQINSVHTAILASGEWSDPNANARMAKAVFDQQGWPAWTTWSSRAYRQYLPAAQAAVAALSSETPAASPTPCAPATPAGLAGGPIRQAAVNYALDQLGKPYQWGATGPDSYDCSGLVWAAYRSAGVTVPRTAGEQMQASTIIPAKQAITGDLLFLHVTATDAGHVEIIVSVAGGIAHTVQAPQTGDVVKLSDLPLAGAVVGRVQT